MNITEANAANVVLRYLLGVEPLPSDDQAREASAMLAERANKALGAGLFASDVERHWQRVEVCPGGES